MASEEGEHRPAEMKRLSRLRERFLGHFIEKPETLIGLSDLSSFIDLTDCARRAGG